MHVLRLHGRGDLRLHEEEAPSPSGDDALLRVTAVGICGSDLHWLEEGSIGDAVLDRPLVLGHEFAGTVASGPRAGERVAVDPAIPCGSCRFCLEGNTNLCVRLRFAGHGTEDGAMRTYMAWPAGRFHPLPDSLTDEEGALLEPLGVALHANDLGKVSRGSRVAVFGSGPIGLLIQQVALSRGAEVVVAADPVAARREAAARYGAAVTLDPGASDYERDLVETCASLGVDVAFEASNDHRAIQAAVEAARPGGKVVITGIPSDDTILLQASTARRKGLTLLLTRRMREVYDRTLELMRHGRVDLAGLVTHRYDLNEYEEAFDAALRRVGQKVIITP